MTDPDRDRELEHLRAEITRLRKELAEERELRASCESQMEQLWLSLEKIMDDNR